MTLDNTNKKILIIEDNQDLRQVILDKLIGNGFSTDSAPDGQKGLELVQSWQPDLVILDLLMPKMNGMTVLKEIRANFGKQLPVIILTNLEPTDRIISDVVQYQPSYYFIKSDTKIDVLINKIKKTFSASI